MKTKHKTEITVETDRTLVIRECHRLDQGWCERRDTQAAGISRQAVTRAGVSPEAISRHVDEGRLHFTDSGDGSSFICLATSTTQERSLLR